MLQKLFDEDWAFEVRDNPEFASQAGVHDVERGADDALQHVSPASYELRAAHSEKMFKAVNQILADARPSELSKEDLIFASLFQSQHADIAKHVRSVPLFLIPVNSIGAGGILYSFTEALEWVRTETASDLSVILARLQACPRQIDEFIASMREGVRTGYVASAAMMRSVDAALTALATDSGPLPELAPALQLADRLGDTALHTELVAASDGCRVAFASLLKFVREEYTPHLRAEPGCAALPCGVAGYAACLRYHTTTDLSPADIHALGVAEVAHIEARYRTDVLAPLGFGPDDFAAFVAQARSDPRFYVTTGDELLSVYRRVCADITAVLPKYFNEFPRSALEVVATDKGPSAFYIAGTPDGARPGKFYVNTHNLSGKPTYEAVALALHEGV